MLAILHVFVRPNYPHVVTTRDLGRIGLARWARWLMGLRVFDIAFFLSVIALTAYGILGSLENGRFTVYRLPQSAVRQYAYQAPQVPAAWSGTGFAAQEVEQLLKTITIDAEKSWNVQKLGERIDSDFLDRNNFPYPLILVHPSREDGSKLTKALHCVRGGTCSFSGHVPIIGQVSVNLQGKPEASQSVAFGPVIGIFMQWNHLDETVETQQFATVGDLRGAVSSDPGRMERPVEAYSYDPDLFRIPYAQFLVTPPDENAPATVSVHLMIQPGKPLLDEECVRSYDSRTGPHKFQSDYLERFKELCTIPADALESHLSVCPPGGPICQVEFPGVPGLTETQRVEGGEYSLPLDKVEDRVLMASLTRDRPMRPAEVTLANQISDQIIADYLLLFWDQPIPPALAAYLEWNSHLRPKVMPPEYKSLLSAAGRRPYLRGFYEIRTTVGSALLEDMFSFLGDLRLLRIKP
jgi:hypothetical protein